MSDADRRSRANGASERTLRPKAALLDIFALTRRLGGWLSVADLVALLGDLGFEDQVARAAISRMKRTGLLVSRHLDGTAGYALSHEAEEILNAGDKRIFSGESPADVDDGWVIVIFSVPEKQRDKRYKLKSQLAWLGCGQVTPGVWIAPRRVLPDLRRTLERTKLSDFVTVFQGSYVGFEPLTTLLQRTWDLTWLQSLYLEFLECQEPVRDYWRTADNGDDRKAFVDYVRAISQWRRLPYVDPGLPVQTLPEDWAGHRAAALFSELRGLLELRTLRHLAALSTTRGVS